MTVRTCACPMLAASFSWTPESSVQGSLYGNMTDVTLLHCCMSTRGFQIHVQASHVCTGANKDRARLLQRCDVVHVSAVPNYQSLIDMPLCQGETWTASLNIVPGVNWPSRHHCAP